MRGIAGMSPDVISDIVFFVAKWLPGATQNGALPGALDLTKVGLCGLDGRLGSGGTIALQVT